jgi:hypothetical protein
VEDTFRCDRCDRETPRRQLKEVSEEGASGRIVMSVCPECLDDLMQASEEVTGIPGKEKQAAVELKSSAETVEVTGARPATTTSSAVEQRPEQAAIAPQEGTFLTEASRPVDSLPDEEQKAETSPSRASVRRAPGLEHDVKVEQGEDDAEVIPEPQESSDERP